jgi:mono/diheme cytochrome c family protein
MLYIYSELLLMLRKFYLLIFILSIFSCNSNITTYSKYLNKESLTSQFITIDNRSDTLIKTANGALLKIAKGSFSADVVKLEIKEAYTIEQMILAGLVTKSNDKLLSSGGMIYINAIDEKIQIKKPVSISIPTTFYDGKMQLFKGEEKDGKVNWTNPVPLSIDSLPPYLQAGKLLFEQSCLSCHTLDKDGTGPKLSGLESRGPWKDRDKLIAFTKNPAAFIPKTCYTKALQRAYNQIMPAYPQLGDTAMNAIYDYIRNEDLRKGINLTNNYNSTCDDSCWAYDSVLHAIEYSRNKRREIIESNESEQRLKYDIQNSRGGWKVNDKGKVNDKVAAENYQSIYYQFQISATGWYNIDQMIDMNKDLENALLKVKVQGQNENGVSVFLAIPALRVFADGGRLDDGEEYGFYKNDGTIPLPIGSEMYVFAISEGDDKVLFDYKKVIAVKNQTINLNLTPVSKEEFNSVIKSWSLSGIDISSKDSKIRMQLKAVDNDIKQLKSSLEQLQPKNCDCSCGLSDSAKYDKSIQ